MKITIEHENGKTEEFKGIPREDLFSENQMVLCTEERNYNLKPIQRFPIVFENLHLSIHILTKDTIKLYDPLSNKVGVVEISEIEEIELLEEAIAKSKELRGVEE